MINCSGGKLESGLSLLTSPPDIQKILVILKGTILIILYVLLRYISCTLNIKKYRTGELQ